MTEQKFKSLSKYAEDVKSRLENPTPSKWAHAPVEYKNFLIRELRTALAKLEEYKLANVKETKK